MGLKKIRIIDKQGKAKFVMPHIANDSKLMASYGFTIEDPSLKEEMEETPIVEDPSLKEEVVETETKQEPTQEKKKPGSKSKGKQE